MLSVAVPDDARVFEVDLPATQAAKRRAIPDGLRQVTYVPIDLSSSSLRSALLAAPGFDPRADTVFVAEGLLMYLDRPVVEGIFADMTELEGRVRLVASVVTPDPKGRVRLHSQRRVVDLCMRLLGERFVWGESVERLEETLAAYDFDLEAVSSTTELRSVTKEPVRGRRPTGEVIVVASGRHARARALGSRRSAADLRAMNGAAFAAR
jgi:methyltransferase (TIGR00027 family)